MEAKKAATITKQELSALPMVSYSGTIFLIDSEEKAIEAAEILAKEKIIGFDTETKPSFKRGHSNNVALLQLSTHTSTFLFRLNRIGLPAPVKAILENKTILLPVSTPSSSDPASRKVSDSLIGKPRNYLPISKPMQLSTP